MKKFFSALALCALCIPASAQTMREWDDVNTTSVNRQTAVQLGLPLTDISQIENGGSPYEMSLNGTWKFKWAPVPEQAPDKFFQDGYNVDGWDDITVPCPWQIYAVRNGKNWDKPLYVNLRYPFTYDTDSYSVMARRPSDWTYNDDMKNPVGCYKRSFTLPENWDGRDTYVRFNGAGHGFYLWVNGKYAGYSEDSYLPAEFNITDYVHKGENTISAQVYRFTSGSFLECQDYWRLTGIMRDVVLWSAPKTQIRDFFFTNTFDDNYTNARVSLDVYPEGEKLPNGSIEVKVLDNGTEVAAATKPLSEIRTEQFNFTVPAPRKWTAETPELYDLLITLKDGDKVIDTRGCKVGFRQVGIRNDGALTINGERILLKGVDRHDFSPETGRTISREEVEQDLLNMKRLNINAIRTSHYPNTPYFYDLCDKLGFYVLAEANVECHGDTRLSGEERFKDAMVERSQNHVRRYRNHPSIFMWSYGNESGGGNNFEAVENAIKALDGTRLTHYEGNSTWADVSSTMYASVSRIEKIGKERLEQANNGTTPRPHIQCESSHSMGNSMGAVRDLWDLYEKYPSLTGEFIWDYKDQGLKMPVPGKPDEYYWAYGGDFGDKPNDNNFCCNGLVFPDLSWSAKSYNTKKIYQPLDFALSDDGRLIVTNKLAFKNSDDYTAEYTILEDGMPLSSGHLDFGTIEAGQSATVALDMVPANKRPDREYHLRINVYQKEATPWAPAGYEVASEQIALNDAVKPAYPIARKGSLNVTETDDAITVAGKNFRATFSRADGTLAAYSANGKTIIDKPLRFNTFRLPTDNDKAHTDEWDRMGLRDMTVEPGEWTVEKKGNTVSASIRNTYRAAVPYSFDVTMNYNIDPDGVIMLNCTFDPAVKGLIIPKMGLRTELPAGFENMTWFGRGPWESYLDRKEACFEGVYSATVDQQRTDYILPQENANKEDVRWLGLTDANGCGMLFVAPEKMAATATHWRPEEQYTNRSNRMKHPYQTINTDKTILCLDAFNRALGNASCGPDVLDKYEIRTQSMPFSLIMMPLDKAMTPGQLSAKARISMAAK